IPFRPDAINDVVPPGVNGVYLWTIPLDDGSFRVYYVGESTNVRQRLRKHYGMQLDGRYTAHDLNDLKRNVRTLVHRATEGMVGRFRNLDRDRFSKEYVESLRIFYAVVA